MGDGGGVARALEMSDNMSMVHTFLCDNFFVCFSNSREGGLDIQNIHITTTYISQQELFNEYRQFDHFP